MALLYIDIKIIHGQRILTMGYQISDSIKQPINSYIITETNTFPEEAKSYMKLMEKSIENGTVK